MISKVWFNSQELVGQLRFHYGMERDDSVETDWNRARLSSIKVGMDLNGLVEVPMRWSMTWTFFDDGMPNTVFKKTVFERWMSYLPGIWVGAKPRLKNPTTIYC